jgi:hypothetical protein
VRDAHRAFEVEDEKLAVPDLTGLCRPGDGVDGLVDLVGRHCHFDFDLGQETDRVFGAAIDFRMALLTPASFNLGHDHAVYTGRGESVSHRVEPERLDDGHDDFHGIDPRSRFGPAAAGSGGLDQSLRRAKFLYPAPVLDLANQAACQILARHKCLEMMHFLLKLELAVAGASADRTNTAHDCIVFNLYGAT